MPPVKPLFGTPLNRAHPLANGLVACFLLNEGSGNTAYDSAGNGNHGTLTGFADPATPTSGWRAGPHGGALQYDNINDVVICSNLSQFDTTNDCSMIVTASVTGAWSGLCGIGANDDGMFYILMHPDTPDSYVEMRFKGAGSGICDIPNGTRQMNILVEHTFVAVKQGALFSGYIDGGMYGSTSVTGVPTHTQPFKIGSGNNLFCGGSISFCAFYNRALSASEVAYLNAFPYCMFDQPDYDPSYDVTKYFYRNKPVHANLVAVSFLQAIPEKQAEIQTMLQSLALVSGQSELDREIVADLSGVSIVQGAANRLHELQAILQAVSALSGQTEISRQVSADLQAIGFPEAVAECIGVLYELTAHLVAVSQGSANAYEEQDISAQLIAIAALNGRALTHYRTVVLQFETIMKKYLHDQTIF